MNRNSHSDFKKAQALRKNASDFEQRLWELLRVNGRLQNIKFRRQVPIHPYIVDFACSKAKLIIELGRPSHDGTQAYDKQRTTFLKKEGFDVFRFTNDDVSQNAEGVVTRIIETINAKLSSPTKGREKSTTRKEKNNSFIQGKNRLIIPS